MTSPSTSSSAAPCICVQHCDLQRTDTAVHGSTCRHSATATASTSTSRHFLSPMDAVSERLGDYARTWLPSVILFLLRACGLLLDVISTTTGDFWCIRLLVLTFLPAFVDACSTRPSPKPRPARPYWHPDKNLPRLNCTDDYRDLYCLNNGSCYMQLDISSTERPYCICADGYRGRRCENIHDDNVYLPALQAKRIETAALSALVTLLVVATCIASLALYLYRRRAKYPVEYVDAASEISTVDYPFNMRSRHDAQAFRARRMESTPIGTPMTAQQTTVDFWPQESEAGGSRDSSRPHVHRSKAPPQIVELGPSSV